MSNDPMKKAIVDVLVKENGLELSEPIDSANNSYVLLMNGVSYWITPKGNIRFINPERKDILDMSDFENKQQDQLETIIYLIKKYKQTRKEK